MLGNSFQLFEMLSTQNVVYLTATFARDVISQQWPSLLQNTAFCHNGFALLSFFFFFPFRLKIIFNKIHANITHSEHCMKKYTRLCLFALRSMEKAKAKGKKHNKNQSDDVELNQNKMLD